MKALPALLALLLTGCATYQWRHADAAANFDSDSYTCRKESAQAFPPQIRERISRPPQFYPGRWLCPSASSDPAACRWQPGFWREPEHESYDVNAQARDELYRSCLKARGWAYLRVD